MQELKWVTQQYNENILADFQEKNVEEGKHGFGLQMELHFAHIIMLAEQGIISKEEAGQLLAALQKLWDLGPDVIEIKPGLTDLFSNLQEWLVKEVGIDVGGKMHIGRSRNDMYGTLDRMIARSYLIDFGEKLCILMEGLLEKCKENMDVVMPGYTHHDQHAQPTTMGHYMLWAFDVFYKDMTRALDCYQRMNYSAMGAAALCGTGFPVNRERMADLLGFDGVCENTIDATSSRDFQFEMASVFCIYLANLARLSELMLIWNVREIDMIRMDRKYCSYSSIMPQKNNPIGIENIRGAYEVSCGQLAGMFTVLKGMTPGSGREICFTDELLGGIIAKTIPTPVFMRDMIRDMKVQKENCLRLAKEGFSTITELADDMVRKKGQSFAFAHKVLSKLAAKCMDQNIPCEEIDGQMIDEIAMELFNRKVGFTDEEVRMALDPVENVQMRKTRGGPAPEEVDRMRKERVQKVAEMKKLWADKKQFQLDKMAAIQEEAKKYMK